MKSKIVSMAALCALPFLFSAARAANLSGQAFVTAQGGETVTCAGREVIVVPDGKGAFPRRTLCDAQGHFAFANLDRAGWTIHTAIHWDIRAKQSIRHCGGDIAQHVVLQPGDNDIVLNDRNVVSSGPQTRALAQASP